MNQKNVIGILLPGVLLPVGIVVIINILSGGENQIGGALFYFGLALSVFGLVAPRIGLLIFFVVQYYLDFFKRLLAVGDNLSMNDVVTSLALGPLLMVVICVSVTHRGVTGVIPCGRLRDVVFIFGCVIISLVGPIVFGNTEGLLSIGQSILGSAMLGMTAYATFMVFRNRNDARLVIKVLLLGAMPFVLYTFYQAFIGIPLWEENYIRTGMSSILHRFYILDGIDEMRPFSTMNTHTSLGAVSGALFLVCLLISFRSKRVMGSDKHLQYSYLLYSFLFLAVCILSRNRTTFLIPVMGVWLYWLFKGGLRTTFFYLAGIIAFVWIVANSSWINANILDWSYSLGGTAIGRQIGTLGIFQARLDGFINLSDFNYWTPFGLPENLRPSSHDPVTRILMTVGFIPLGIALLLLSFLVFWWHRQILRMSNLTDRRFVIALTTVIVLLGISGVLYGNLFFVAPVNSLLGAMIGLCMARIRHDFIDRSLNKSTIREIQPENVDYHTGRSVR